MTPPRTLLIISSRQVWPAIIAVSHFRPERVVLLHTSHELLSLQPSRRLRDFLHGSELVAPGACVLHEIPDDDFNGIQTSLDQLPDELKRASALGFNAGSKLMAAAAFDWAKREKLQAFYLEWDDELQRFDFASGGVLTARAHPDLHRCDHLDPLSLIRCQAGVSLVSRSCEILSPRTNGFLDLAPADFDKKLFRTMAVNPSDWLDSKNAAGTRARQKGDPLEYATVIAALRAGVRQVARGVRLSIALPDSAGSQLHAELDVVFTYRGRLWVIEVKDRKEVEGARALIKEKIVAAWEVGGDLGRFVYVSRTVPGPDLLAFAKSLGVAIVPKGNLRNGMSQLLKEQPRPHLP